MEPTKEDSNTNIDPDTKAITNTQIAPQQNHIPKIYPSQAGGPLVVLKNLNESEDSPSRKYYIAHIDGRKVLIPIPINDDPFLGVQWRPCNPSAVIPPAPAAEAPSKSIKIAIQSITSATANNEDIVESMKQTLIANKPPSTIIKYATGVVEPFDSGPKFVVNKMDMCKQDLIFLNELIDKHGLLDGNY